MDLLYFLHRNLIDGIDSEHFICGPTGMIDLVDQVLRSIDIAKKNIHIERFGINFESKINVKLGYPERVSLTFNKEGQQKTILVDGNKTIFQSLTEAGESIYHSCLAGSCASCACVLNQGEVEMMACEALSETQINDRFILTCQAYPITENIEINFDVI